MADDARALCDQDGCGNLARYVETNDTRAPVSDPDRRCDDHKPGHGLWRDLAAKYGQILEDAGYV